jgi:serine/threonine protein kinase
MKVFPFTGHGICHYFVNEARFGFLEHANIVSFIEGVPKAIDLDGNPFSYVLSGYCKYGDLTKILMSKRFKTDLKLARTIFQQILNGLSYLHHKGIAHLDLKPENLTVSEDFSIKIIDFDTAYMIGDEKVLSKGTPTFRAPEVKEKRCLKPKKADIYSAGIVLFGLVTGALPFMENENDQLKGLFNNCSEEFWTEHVK